MKIIYIVLSLVILVCIFGLFQIELPEEEIFTFCVMNERGENIVRVEGNHLKVTYGMNDVCTRVILDNKIMGMFCDWDNDDYGLIIVKCEGELK